MTSAPLVVSPPPPGYARVRAVTSNDFIADIIEIGTRAHFDHIETVLPDGSIIAAHAAGGVRHQPADYDTSSMAQQFIDIPMSPDMLAKWVAYLESRVGCAYDFGAILDFILDVDEHVDVAYICSALTILSLRDIGVIPNPLSEPAHKISPRDVVLILSSWPNTILHPIEIRR
jgi:hypothetical protein